MSRHSLKIRLLAAFCCAFFALPHAQAEEIFSFDNDIRPLLDTYCVQCHNTDKLKGDFNIDRFTSTEMAADALGVWQRVAKRIESREMPPRKEMQPSDEERMRLIKWVGTLKPTDNCDKLSSEESVSWYIGYVMSRRINRAEYENSLRDLFGVPLNVAKLFPADGAGGEGFDNNGSALFLSPIQIEKYLEAADYAVENALPSDRVPRPAGSRRTPGESELSGDSLEKIRLQEALKKRIVSTQPSWRQSPEDAARSVLQSFAYRAWRRPVTPDEVEGLLRVFKEAYSRSGNYYEAIKLALKGALVSPHFLFLAEPQPEVIGDYPLGDYPLAARLSYFLWASTPDAELMHLAGEGKLQQDEVLTQQIDRMLHDPKAQALGKLFAAQWLGIDQLGEIRKPDEKRFPEFDDALLVSMKEETELYFNRIISEDRSLLELIDSDYTYVDERLAEIYGIENVSGDKMQLVQLASNTQRGGVLGMSAVLTATSHPLRTSPVLRGKWVLEQLLGDRVPPPPPNVPTLPEDDHNEAGLTLRQQLEAHRENPDCAGCHSRMDPIGFGMENYDPIGRWRETQADQPVDATGTLPSGETFNGPAEMKKIILDGKDAFARNLSQKMLGYALGRSLTPNDTCVLDRSLKALQENEYRPSVLFKEIILSYPFRHRYSGGEHESTPKHEP